MAANIQPRTTNAPAKAKSTAPKEMPQKRRHPATAYGITESMTAEQRRDLLQGPQVTLAVKNRGGKDTILVENVSKHLMVTFAPSTMRFLNHKTNVIRFPVNSIEPTGADYLVKWMEIVCESPRPLRLLFAEGLTTACHVQRALKIFGLHHDARFYNKKIKELFNADPIHPDEVTKIWENLPHDSEHVHGMVKNIAYHRRDPRNHLLMNWEAIYAYARANSDLHWRILDPAYNEACMAKKETPTGFAARKEKGRKEKRGAKEQRLREPWRASAAPLC